VQSLANQSKVPHHKREGETTLIREYRIGRLRERYLYYRKKKLTVLCEKEYPERMATWKIEWVIQRYKFIMIKGRWRRMPERESEPARSRRRGSLSQ
jgi:hypothetical protein